ncbi:MAG: hypothetical protein HIU93_15500 [Acidobacteria bacterium]|nr:hypothetical protein [Acidobacteriota bacterium]
MLILMTERQAIVPETMESFPLCSPPRILPMNQCGGFLVDSTKPRNGMEGSISQWPPLAPMRERNWANFGTTNAKGRKRAKVEQ